MLNCNPLHITCVSVCNSVDRVLAFEARGRRFDPCLTQAFCMNCVSPEIVLESTSPEQDPRPVRLPGPRPVFRHEFLFRIIETNEETYGALFDRSDRFLVDCATLASRESAGSEPPISLLCTWFRQRVSIALQRSLAHAIHVRTLRLEQSMALLPRPPPRASLSSSELLLVASFC